MLKFLGWMLTLLLVGAAVVAVLGTQRYLGTLPHHRSQNHDHRARCAACQGLPSNCPMSR